MDITLYGDCSPCTKPIVITNELAKIIEQLKTNKILAFVIDYCLNLDLEI